MFKMKEIPNSGGMFALMKDGQFVKGGTREDLKMFIDHTNSKENEFKGKFHCRSNCTECCHQLVKISESEIFRIRRYLRSLERSEWERLKKQERNKDVCPLLDMEKGTCSIYEVRPNVCKAFGHYTGAMACSYNLDVELEPVEGYFNRMLFADTSKLVGQLGVDFTWDKGLVRW